MSNFSKSVTNIQANDPALYCNNIKPSGVADGFVYIFPSDVGQTYKQIILVDELECHYREDQ